MILIKKDEKITTAVEPVSDGGVVNKSYLDKKISKKMVYYRFYKKIITNINYNTTSNL